jgi:hypothetical protein
MIEQRENVPEAHFVCVVCDRFVIGDVIIEALNRCATDSILCAQSFRWFFAASGKVSEASRVYGKGVGPSKCPPGMYT